ncbi:HIT domain-containing protein [Microbacteriaceae bacterium]|nr:HIT domain-containing protein [Candidatus Saccharibacteria bacterium]
MEDSLFTKIINDEIPSHKVYEDDNTIAFLDIYPTMPGHTLVVPKRQVATVWDLEETDYTALMATVSKVAKHLRELLPQQYVGVKIVGVDVPHAHVHLIPFDTPKEYAQPNNMTVDPDHELLAQMAEKLRLS